MAEHRKGAMSGLFHAVSVGLSPEGMAETPEFTLCPTGAVLLHPHMCRAHSRPVEIGGLPGICMHLDSIVLATVLYNILLIGIGIVIGHRSYFWLLYISEQMGTHIVPQFDRRVELIGRLPEACDSEDMRGIDYH